MEGGTAVTVESISINNGDLGTSVVDCFSVSFCSGSGDLTGAGKVSATVELVDNDMVDVTLLSGLVALSLYK